MNEYINLDLENGKRIISNTNYNFVQHIKEIVVKFWKIKKIKHPTKTINLLNVGCFLYALISYKIRLYPLYQPTK